MSAPATFDRGGVLPRASMHIVAGGGVLSLPRTRRERLYEKIAMKAWVGRQRRIGLSHWSGGGKGLPLVFAGPEGVYSQVFKAAPGTLKWIRIPGTGWCLSTYRRSG